MKNREKIIELLLNVTLIDYEEINENTSFRNDLAFDSIDRIELIMWIEKEYQVSIPDNEVSHIETVGQLDEYLNKLISE